MRRIIILAFILSIIIHGVLYCVCSDAVLFDMSEYASKIHGMLQIKVDEKFVHLVDSRYLDESINSPDDTDVLKKSIDEIVDKDNVTEAFNESGETFDKEGIQATEIDTSDISFDQSRLNTPQGFGMPQNILDHGNDTDLVSGESIASDFVDVPVRKSSSADTFVGSVAVDPGAAFADDRNAVFLAVSSPDVLPDFSAETPRAVSIEPAFNSALVFQEESPIESIEIGEISVAEGKMRLLGDLAEFLTADCKTYRKEGEDSVYAKITLSPKESAAFSTIPKDLLFLVDVSGSISEDDIEKIRNDIRLCLTRLSPGDRFNIFLFNVWQQGLYEDLQPVNEKTMGEAIQFIRKIGGGQQTNIYDALMKVIPFIKEGERILHIVFVSDARPTQGTRNFRTIINDFTEHRIGNIALFTYEIGSAKNKFLLDYLAYENRGRAFYEQKGKEDLDYLVNYLEPYEQPVLFDMKIDEIKGDTRDVFPRLLNHVYLDRDIEIYVRLDKEGTFSFDISGLTGSSERKSLQCAINTVGQASENNEEIMKKWAHFKFFELISIAFREGMTDELKSEMDSLKEIYGIKIARELSRYLK